MRVKTLATQVKLFPVPLFDVAKQQRIEKVIFPQHQLPDGCLEPTNTGFIVYVKRLNEQNSDDLTRLLENESSGKDLLPDRMRFTIAHEIAHTFFFDLRPEKPVELIKSSRVEHFKRIEKACDELASKLLLPWLQISEFAKNCDFWNPSILREFAKLAGASDPAVILRLQPFLGYRGFVIFESSEEGCKIKYTSIGEGLLKQFFKIGIEMFAFQLIEQFFGEASFAVRDGSLVRMNCIASSFRRGSLPTSWDCYLIKSYGNRWLMSFSLLD